MVDWRHGSTEQPRPREPTDRVAGAIAALGAAQMPILMVADRAEPRDAMPFVSTAGAPVFVWWDRSRTLADSERRELLLDPPTDEAARRWFIAHIWNLGIDPGMILDLSLRHQGIEQVARALEAQLDALRSWRVPPVTHDPAWVIVSDDLPAFDRVRESVFAIADGRVGTRGSVEAPSSTAAPLVVASGVYDDGASEHLLPGPLWTQLPFPVRGTVCAQVLDLHTGVLAHSGTCAGRPFRSIRFSSLAAPGTMVLWAEGPDAVLSGEALTLPDAGLVASGERGAVGEAEWCATTNAAGGGITAVAHQGRLPIDVLEHDADLVSLRRVAIYRSANEQRPDPEAVARELPTVDDVDHLLREHRATWAQRWTRADVTIDGDAATQLGSRFAIFHLLSSAGTSGETALGARGLTGPAYAGHVFWDADVFVLPALTALEPAAARTMLEYRIRRLPAALANAAAHGAKGARFPWESAHEGSEVTPPSYRDQDGNVVPILTGALEEHITADVAWAAWHYANWTGDERFRRGPGRNLLIETARYWACRVTTDADGRGHITNVMGPDEYHPGVDDNAFTNAMAGWNLRAAAGAVDRADDPSLHAEARGWITTAASLADGFDPDRRCHEQFRGYFGLEPLLVADVAAPPIAADVLLGHERVGASQIIKQPDVLMLHHLLPDAGRPGSLERDLDFYLPRTAHGSSLSPAICASLLARAGRPDDAVELLQLACRIDLDDLTAMTSGGLHLATMGGVWQALAFGFAGLSVRQGALAIDPHLPERWDRVSLAFRVLGRQVRVDLAHDRAEIETDGPLHVALAGTTATVIGHPTAAFVRNGSHRWTRSRG